MSLLAHVRRRHLSIPFHLLALWCRNALDDFVPQNLEELVELESTLGKRLRTPELDIVQAGHRDTADATSTARYMPPHSRAPISPNRFRDVWESTKRARRN